MPNVDGDVCSHWSRGLRTWSGGLFAFAGLGVLSSQVACEATTVEAETGVVEAALSAPGDEMLGLKLNRAGLARSATPTGTIDHANPFFTPLGVNGRTCGTCHLAGEGWTITPDGVKLRFLLTSGTDPLFRPHDGANAPELDV